MSFFSKQRGNRKGKIGASVGNGGFYMKIRAKVDNSTNVG